MADLKDSYTREEYEALLAEKDALKTNRDEALTEAKKAKSALKNYDGLDPEEYKRLKEASAEAERKKAAAEGDFKSLEAQMKERHVQELGQKDQRIAQLTAALERRLIDADAGAVISEAKGSIRGLLPHVRPHLKVVERDGEFVAVVVDGQGNPRIADGSGNPMTTKDLVNELKADKDLARLFEGTGSSGGGASRTAAGGGGGSVVPNTNSPEFMKNLDAIAKGTVRVAVP